MLHENSFSFSFRLSCMLLEGVGAKCHYDNECIPSKSFIRTLFYVNSCNILDSYCRHQLMCFCKKDYYAVSEDQWSCKGESIQLMRDAFRNWASVNLKFCRVIIPGTIYWSTLISSVSSNKNSNKQ